MSNRNSVEAKKLFYNKVLYKFYVNKSIQIKLRRYSDFLGSIKIISKIRNEDRQVEYACLDQEGVLSINEAYAWDGMSAGFVSNTHRNLFASLIHDVLYQIMCGHDRELGNLNRDAFRLKADKTFFHISRANGVSYIKAWLAYKAVRIFGQQFTVFDPIRIKRSFTYC